MVCKKNNTNRRDDRPAERTIHARDSHVEEDRDCVKSMAAREHRHTQGGFCLEEGGTLGRKVERGLIDSLERDRTNAIVVGGKGIDPGKCKLD
jgi:hypothetical protein